MENKVIICRCEEVDLAELVETMEVHRCTSRELKLRTRAGMGYCGGRTCRPLIDQIVGEYLGPPSEETIPLVYQPPVRPIRFGKGMNGNGQR